MLPQSLPEPENEIRADAWLRGLNHRRHKLCREKLGSLQLPLWTECLHLTRVRCWKPKPPVWLYLETGLWEVSMLEEVMEMGLSWCIRCSYRKRHQRACPLSRHKAMWAHRKTAPPTSQEKGLRMKSTLQAPWSWRTLRNKHLLFNPPNRWYFCYRSPSWWIEMHPQLRFYSWLLGSLYNYLWGKSQKHPQWIIPNVTTTQLLKNSAHIPGYLTYI